MATSTAELILKFTGDPSQLKQTLAQVRADLSQSGKAQVAVTQEANRQVTTGAKSLTKELEQEERQRVQAAQTLQKQRAAALIAQWREEERERVRTVRQSQQQIEAEEKRLAAAMIREARAAQTVRTQQERERVRSQKQTTREIEAEEKRLAQTMIREARAATNARLQFERQALAEIKRLERERAQIARQNAQATSGQGAVPFGQVLQGLTQTLTTIQGPLSGTASRVTSLAGLFTGLTAGVGGAAVGLGVMTTATIAAGVGVFNLAKSVADATGKFFDLSQQVGVSVETLSTLDVLASTTGGNIDTVTASLALFQRNLESAHDPTSKEAKLLKELGVTSLDTEAALRQTLKGLFALGEGAKQTDASIELFGRSGRFVNAILKESKGDLDAATKKFTEMGLIVGGPAAAAADRFNDSLEIIHRQVIAVSRALISDSIPVFIAFFEQISIGLTGNANSWKSWGTVVESTVAGVIASMQALVAFIASRGTASFSDLFDAFFFGILKRAQAVRNEIFAQSEMDRFNRIAALVTGGAGTVGDRPDAGKAASEAQARANKAIQLQQQELEEATRVHREALQRERELEIKSIDDWERESTDVAIRHLSRSQDIFEKERANIRRFVQDREEQSQALKAIDLKDEKAQNDFTLAVQKIQDDARKRRDEAVRRADEQLFRIREVERQGEQQRIRAQLERQEITEAESLTRRLALEKQSHAERLALLNQELEQLSTVASRHAELINLRIEAEQKFTDETKRLIEERNAAREREVAAQAPQTITDVGGRILSPEQIDILGDMPDAPVRNLTEAFDRLGESIATATGLSGEFAQQVGRDFGDILNSGFQTFARGIGEIVHNYVLLGETGPAVLKKLLASTLATIAAEAAVRAVYYTAMGIAALFLNPGAAAGYFTAAALFAGIAGGAAIAGRAIAGNSFKPKTDEREDRPRSLEGLPTIITGRNQRQTIRVENVVRVESNDSHILKVISKDYRDGGETRELVFADGGAR